MMPSTRTPTSPADRSHLLATARALATDAASAEVVRAWRQRGIESILLKGATTATWLYEHESRGYVDADLLVDPSHLMEAAAVLTELGFVPASGHFSDHAHPWIRSSDQAVVDLHVTVWGSTRSPQRVWDELRSWVEPLQLGPVRVLALRVPARALHLALHAAQHRDSPARRTDLRRALQRTSLADWRQAEQLADRIRALPIMAVGLELEPAGRELLRHLALTRAGLLVERQGASLAIGFARLRIAQGIRAKASLIAAAVAAEDEDAPDRRRLARARRVGWLLAGLPKTARSVWRARRHRTARS